jgi:hypothetical protein
MSWSERSIVGTLALAACLLTCIVSKKLGVDLRHRSDAILLQRIECADGAA